MSSGAPALRRLIALKFRGSMRRQVRKLKTWSGLFYACVGLLLTCGWLGSLFIGRRVLSPEPADEAHLMQFTQLAILVLSSLSLITAASVRGVYLPQQDIERLFAAPLTRSDLLRYRMFVDMGRSLFGAFVLGLITFHRMADPWFGMAGIMLTVLSLGILRQFFSMLIGGAGSRLDRFLKGRSLGFLRVLIGVSLWIMIMVTVMGEKFFGEALGGLDLSGGLGSLVEHPVVAGLITPFYPWARMMTASAASDFGTWLLICLGLGIGLFELTARLPIDYREMALDTSSRIAKRLSQVRRGGVFAAGEVSSRTTGWQFPKLFGRGPMGAVAWIKMVTMVRKARGTMLMGTLIVVLVTVGVGFIAGREGSEVGEKRALLASLLIAVLGTAYLCGAFRFDFRADLDRMVQIKAWPVSPARIFVATLWPVACLISGMLGLAIWIRLAVTGCEGLAPYLLPLLLPFVTFAWLGVENVVYLFAPVRFVPGQEGSLHHTGRAIVLVFCRLILMGIVLGLAGVVPGVLFSRGPESFGLGDTQALWISVLAAVAVLMAVDLGLAWLGGRMLSRFDVARDRG